MFQTVINGKVSYVNWDMIGVVTVESDGRLTVNLKNSLTFCLDGETAKELLQAVHKRKS